MKIRYLATTGLIISSLLIGCKKEEVKTIPSLSTIEATAITDVSAESGGIISENGNDDIIERGVCWSASIIEPTISNNKISSSEVSDSFKIIITGLEPSTTYFAKAYATNSIGTAYGNTVIFKTNFVETIVTTSFVSLITANTAQGGGAIDATGNPIIISRGVCWDIEPNPDLSNSYTDDGTGYGEFRSDMAGLESNTTYYFRAYATNSDGYTSFGADSTFVTLADPPELTTTNVSSITQTSAISGGNISSDGGDTIVARGVCFGLSEMPTIDDQKTDDGGGIGVFESNLTELSSGTMYYIRAYATNSQGMTAYGEEYAFRTLGEIVYPDSSNFGTNVLSIPITSVIERELYSFTAQLPEGSELTIIVKGGSMLHALGSNINWSISKYNTETQTQTFSSVIPGIDCELGVKFISGPATVEYYENGATSPTITKTISISSQ